MLLNNDSSDYVQKWIMVAVFIVSFCKINVKQWNKIIKPTVSDDTEKKG